MVDVIGSIKDETVPWNWAPSPLANPKHRKQIRMHTQKEKM